MPIGTNNQIFPLRPPPLVGGIGNGSVSPFTVPRGTTATGPLNRPKLSVSQMMGMNARGGPNISIVTDAATGRRLTTAEAADRGPFTVAGSAVGGRSGYGRSGYGGYGGERPRSRISSAGVAGGTPTSRRGRFEQAMQENPMLSPEQAWMDSERPAWDQPRPDPFASNPRYGNMGRPPIRTYAEGTKTRPAPYGQPFIAGDPKKDGKPNPEVIVPTEDGMHVVPITMSALDELEDVGTGLVAGPKEGEIRTDAEGNKWRYDAKTGRGIPMNPYVGNPNAPSPDAFKSSASERYLDLAMRLDALRQAGVAEGRAAVGRMRGQQAEEEARRKAFLATGEQVVPEQGGGTMYRTPYGTAIVGGNRPRSFTVENFEGGQTTSGDLAAVDRESRADAAERTVRGLGTRGYRAIPNEVPSTVEKPPPSAIDDLEPEPERGLGVPPPVLAERGLGQPPKPTGIVNRGAFDDIEEDPAPDDAPDIKPPTNDTPRPELKSKATELVESLGDRVSNVVTKGGAILKDLWDTWFTPGGTKAQREAREKLDALTPEQAKAFNEELKKALEAKGYVVRGTENGGYVLTERRK